VSESECVCYIPKLHSGMTIMYADGISVLSGVMSLEGLR
jgi:hypothetical protein